MRIKLVAFCLLLIGCVGCANRAATAPVPGQINTYDAWAYRVLADTQAALNAFKADVLSGKVTETPTIKTTFNQATTDYDIAEATYQAWHAAGGAGSTSALSMQISKVQAETAAALGGGK